MMEDSVDEHQQQVDKKDIALLAAEDGIRTADAVIARKISLGEALARVDVLARALRKMGHSESDIEACQSDFRRGYAARIDNPNGTIEITVL